MAKTDRNVERKIFGGANFLVVLWTLISIFRLSAVLEKNPLEAIMTVDLFAYVLPLLFLAIINIFMGITLFIPQKKNKMWVISILIVSVTLVALNTFQLKIDNTQRELENQSETVEF